MLSIKSFVFNPIQENTYILYKPNGACVIIDPGCYFDEENALLSSFISNNGLAPQALLNTHCHLDHVFGNKYVAEKYGLTLQIHSNEKVMLEHAPTSGLMYNLPFDNYVGDLIFLNPGKEITIDDEVLQILFTPGHSPGSLSFYHAKGSYVVCGDALFQRSIGRTDLPGGNHNQLIESIRTSLFALPDETVVYSGHGEPTTIGEEKRLNPFLL